MAERRYLPDDPEPLEAPPPVPGGTGEYRPEDRLLAPLIGLVFILAAVLLGALIAHG